MREATYRTAYPVSARQYYDLMLSSAFQRDVHVHGLRMRVWDNVDEYPAPRALMRRVYSEPSLKLPKWMARFARKSQAYTEYSEFCPETLTRKTRVVPKIGANLMEFVVEERYENVEGSVVGKRKKAQRRRRRAWWCRWCEFIARFDCFEISLKSGFSNRAKSRCDREMSTCCARSRRASTTTCWHGMISRAGKRSRRS